MEGKFASTKLGTIVSGVALAAMGVILFANPTTAMLTITSMVGWVLVIMGVVSLASALTRWSAILSTVDLYTGILELLFGILLVNIPGFFVTWIFVLLGIFILVSGLNSLYGANALQALGMPNAGTAKAGAILAIVLGVLVLLVCIAAVAAGWGEPAEISADEYGALPFATLTDLTGSDTVQEKTSLTAQGSVLAPCILHYDEDAYIGTAPCHLYVDYYQTAAPWMAQRLAAELHDLKKNLAPDPVSIPCPAGVDAAYAYDNEGVFEQVILVKGDTVMSALWFGEMPNRTEDFLPILAEKMQG